MARTFSEMKGEASNNNPSVISTAIFVDTGQNPLKNAANKIPLPKTSKAKNTSLYLIFAYLA